MCDKIKEKKIINVIFLISQSTGNLFFWYPGHFLVDFNPDLFPSDDYRKRFLRLYLEEKNKLNNVKMNKIEFDEQLTLLFHQTNLCTLSKLLEEIIMLAIFDLKPDFLKNEEFVITNSCCNTNISETKYLPGRFGYEVRCNTIIH